jgi:hexosaminidase
MNLPRFPLCLFLAALLLSATSARPRSASHAPSAARFQLMPVPAAMAPADGKLMIDGSLRVAITGYTEPRLTRAAIRFLLRLQGRTGIPLAAEPSKVPETSRIVIRCGGPGEKVQSVRADESYNLVVTPEKVLLEAPSPLGVMHGLETLLQLVALDAESFHFPAVSIQDRPRFPWRGLLIDVARHWQPVEVILRNLDAMAAFKMNVFHWHLSEDQGFRMESRSFPELHGRGSDGLYYTQAQVREVVAYARERGIRVIPEFDMPGHTASWFAGYPELASAPGPYAIERGWGVFDPCMDPTREQLYTFLDAFLAEITLLFPDAYWHIGGDEVNGRQWNSNPRIAAFKKSHGMKSNEDLQAYFNKRLIALLTRHGKRAVGWDEILHPDLPKSAVIQSWRGQAALAQSAQQGYSGILSWGYYIDHLRSAAFHYQVDPMGQQAASLPPGQKAMLLGGEACMWGEYITYENIDSRIWPRTAAIAERLWSPPEIKDVEDMYLRLACRSRDLESLGLTHNSSYPRMLLRMTGDLPWEPLKTLGDIVESLKQLARARARSYTSLTPMNRLTDAVPPESDLARHFNRRVDQALANPAGLRAQSAELRRWLMVWRENHSLLQPLLQQSCLLRELEPVSENVMALAAAGLQALEHLESGRKPSESWSRDQAALLQRVDPTQAETQTRIQPPPAELLIMIIPGVRKLIAAASQIQ